jgi:prephenate dehydrogenase
VGVLIASLTAMTQLPVIQPGRVGPASDAPPVFEKIGIVGLGLIGGSIALASRQLWPKALVIGVDNKDVLETAMRLHAIDVAADDLIVLAEADVVILAAPVRTNIALLEEIDENVHQPAVITDTGSTKREIVEAAGSLPARFTFIGGHPLAGAAHGGLEYARADLFSGRPWLLTPAARPEGRALREGRARALSSDARSERSEGGALREEEARRGRPSGRPDAHGEGIDKLTAFVTALGALPRITGVEEHDRLLAFLSHLPQLTASALMQVVGDAVGLEGLALAGRGLADTTRLASSPADIWRDIAATNADEIGAALDALIARLQDLRRDLREGDTLADVFSDAARWRATIRKA